MKVVAAVNTAALLLALSACDSDDGNNEGDGFPGLIVHTDVDHPYAGPLTRAKRVVECQAPIAQAHFSPAEDYNGGGIGDDPVDGLGTYIDKLGWIESWPRTGYRIEREESDRVLFTIDVAGERKSAVILHEADTPEGHGWFVESWARCDPSEFPEAVAEEMGYLVWSVTNGRVPTTEIVSFRGAEHCDDQESTILRIHGARYWGNPKQDYRKYLTSRYVEGIELPAGAIATGYSRGGRELWLSSDKANAYVGTKESVDRWPREKVDLRCA